MGPTKIFFAVLLVSGLFYSCSPSSQITASWKNPKSHMQYGSVMVAAMTHSIQAKSTVENDMAAALGKKGVIATKSMEVFPPNFAKDMTREQLLDKVRDKGTGAILTITLVDKKTESRYTPGTYGYVPMPVYGRFWGYYTYWYPTMYSPGYYSQDKIYYMETNLYDAQTEELIWSAESQTYDPNDLSGFSLELANIIANKLDKDGVIRKNNTEYPAKRTISRN